MTRPSIDRARQFDLFRADAAEPVTVIGAGGIGSPLVLALAKMGVEDLTVYDFDVVGEENVASQLYRLDDVTVDPPTRKVDALARTVRDFAGVELRAVAERYVDQPLGGVVVAAVDSMDMRMRIWEQVKLNPDVTLFIDGRMGGLIALVQAVRPCDPDDIRRYESRLHPSKDAAQEPCTARAIVFNTFGLAAVIAASLRKWWVDGEAVALRTLDWDALTVL